MLKEIKYLTFIVIIILFIFLTGKYYYSDTNKKNSYRALKNIDQKINLYNQNVPVLENNTKNIIEYVKNSKVNKNKKYYFWELIDKND